MSNWPGARQRDNWSKHGDNPSLRDFTDIKGNGKEVTDGVCQNDSTTFTSDAADFRGCEGFMVAIRLAGPNTQLTFTVDTGTDELTTSDVHSLGNLQRVRVKSTGTLPSPLAEDTDYYTRDVGSDTLKLSATLGGSVIDLTTEGTGTHTLIMGITTLVTTIQSVQNANTFTAADAAHISATGCVITWGSDDFTALQAAYDQIGGFGGQVIVPMGNYLVNGDLQITKGMILNGQGEVPSNGQTRFGSGFTYFGSGTLMRAHHATDASAWIYRIYLRNLYFRSVRGRDIAARAVDFDGVSEFEVKNCLFGGVAAAGFGQALRLRGSLASIKDVSMTGHRTGVLVRQDPIYSNFVTLLMENCNMFTTDKMIHIIGLTHGVFTGNWIEQFDSAVYVSGEDAAVNGSMLNVSFHHNSFSTKVASYPTPRIMRFRSADPSKFVSAQNVSFDNNLCFAATADTNTNPYLIDFEMAGGNASSSFIGRFHRNKFWGGVTAAIHSDLPPEEVGKLSIELSNNDARDEWSSATLVPEVDGNAVIAGYDKDGYDIHFKNGIKTNTVSRFKDPVGDSIQVSGSHRCVQGFYPDDDTSRSGYIGYPNQTNQGGSPENYAMILRNEKTGHDLFLIATDARVIVGMYVDGTFTAKFSFNSDATVTFLEKNVQVRSSSGQPAALDGPTGSICLDNTGNLWVKTATGWQKPSVVNTDAKFVLREADPSNSMPNAFSLGSLASGILKNTVSGGVGSLSTAIPTEINAGYIQGMLVASGQSPSAGQVLYWNGGGYWIPQILSISDVNGLQAQLDWLQTQINGKASNSHSHNFTGNSMPTHDHGGTVAAGSAGVPSGTISTPI